MKISAHGLTHIGHVRQRNEDAFLLDLDNNLFAVADGLGGLPDGDDASQIAINVLSQRKPNSPITVISQLEETFIEANRAVYEEGFKRHGANSIGTTLTAAYIQNDRLYVAHVGDSALYLLRDGQLNILTQEHTMAAHYGAGHSNHHIPELPEYFYHTLTQCIGSTPTLEVNTSHRRLLPSDQLLLCTDGLIKVIDIAEIEAILNHQQNPQFTSEALLDLALERGAPDNLAIITIHID